MIESTVLHRFTAKWVRRNTLIGILTSCASHVLIYKKSIHRPYIRWVGSSRNNTHVFACDNHGQTAQHGQRNHDVANLYPDIAPCCFEELRPVEDRAEFPSCSSMCDMRPWGAE